MGRKTICPANRRAYVVSLLLGASHAFAAPTGAQRTEVPQPGAVALVPLNAQAPLAVMPMEVTGRAALMDGGPLLAGALARRLQELGKRRVISPTEVESLVQAEADRQAVGAEDDGAWMEAAGAMGADAVVTGRVYDTDTYLRWDLSLVRTSDAGVLAQATVKGKSLGSLLARVDEVALALLGRASEAALSGAAARKRLGLSSEVHLAAFREFREAHAEDSLPEAFTAFLRTRNLESIRLAVAESVAFGVGASLLILSASTWIVAIGVTYVLPLAPLGMIPVLAGPCLCLGGLGAWAIAAVLAIMDALNRDRVPVTADGCCRDDTLLEDEFNARDGPLRAAAVAILLTGPAVTLAGFASLGLYAFAQFSIAMLAVATGVSKAITPEYSTAPATAVTGQCIACAAFPSMCACVLPCMASPLGLILLLWPSPAIVDRAPTNASNDDVERTPAANP